MELSDSQFEHIVGLLAENRAGIAEIKSELQDVERRLMREISVVAKTAALTHSLAMAIEEDVGKVQVAVRRQGETQRTTIQSYDQTLDGITQLCRSTWDVVESTQSNVKHIREELDRSVHDEGITTESRSHRQQ